ncbi:MAG: hypothetical protein O2964_04420 [Verrucomicrobia bacterium]|nr:hypothetical protein [Verrucomicrobiota bacterium]
MLKFLKTNWPLLLLALIASLIMNRILEIRRTDLPDIKRLEQEEENRNRPTQTTRPQEKESGARPQPPSQ